jgi:nucleoside-diphosphate-sugar epimerase
MTVHRQLLDKAVQASAPMAPGLRGLPIYVSGASGFLASSLLVLLSEMDRQHGLGLKLYASARRKIEDVRLFDFVRIRPNVQWQIAPVETAALPNVPGLIVVHTASYGSPRDYQLHPFATFDANTAGLKSLYAQAAAIKAAQFVYFSSGEVYGQPPDSAIPTPESYIGGVDLLSPRSIYGESKRMAEVLGTCLAEQTGIPFVAIRPWNTYGPGQRLEDGRVPMEFIRQARQDRAIKLASNGSPRRSFCHVWDGSRQVMSVFGRTTKTSAFNTGCGTAEISILELARACAAACGLPEKAVTYDAKANAPGLLRCAPNVAAVSRLPGTPVSFDPLEPGLQTLVEWVDFLEAKK